MNIIRKIAGLVLILILVQSTTVFSAIIPGQQKRQRNRLHNRSFITNYVRGARRYSKKNTLYRKTTVISNTDVITFAANFIGTPYAWGGTSPRNGFDCSGFTQYVYAHCGVKLGRTTKKQIHDGVAVSRQELKAGDLVFFGKRGVPNHTGIYAGNNTYIHSPQTGDTVKISPMNRKDFIIGRRILTRKRVIVLCTK